MAIFEKTLRKFTYFSVFVSFILLLDFIVPFTLTNSVKVLDKKIVIYKGYSAFHLKVKNNKEFDEIVNKDIYQVVNINDSLLLKVSPVLRTWLNIQVLREGGVVHSFGNYKVSIPSPLVFFLLIPTVLLYFPLEFFWKQRSSIVETMLMKFIFYNLVLIEIFSIYIFVCIVLVFFGISLRF